MYKCVNVQIHMRVHATLGYNTVCTRYIVEQPCLDTMEHYLPRSKVMCSSIEPPSPSPSLSILFCSSDKALTVPVPADSLLLPAPFSFPSAFPACSACRCRK